MPAAADCALCTVTGASSRHGYCHRYTSASAAAAAAASTAAASTAAAAAATTTTAASTAAAAAAAAAAAVPAGRLRRGRRCRSPLPTCPAAAAPPDTATAGGTASERRKPLPLLLSRPGQGAQQAAREAVAGRSFGRCGGSCWSACCHRRRSHRLGRRTGMVRGTRHCVENLPLSGSYHYQYLPVSGRYRPRMLPSMCWPRSLSRLFIFYVYLRTETSDIFTIWRAQV